MWQGKWRLIAAVSLVLIFFLICLSVQDRYHHQSAPSYERPVSQAGIGDKDPPSSNGGSNSPPDNADFSRRQGDFGADVSLLCSPCSGGWHRLPQSCKCVPDERPLEAEDRAEPGAGQTRSKDLLAQAQRIFGVRGTNRGEPAPGAGDAARASVAEAPEVSNREKPFGETNPFCRRRSSSDTQRLPDFIVVGAAKAGTAALRAFLKLHPNIDMAEKEVMFFINSYENGFDWYRQQMPFAPADTIIGEKSPGYFGSPLAQTYIEEYAREYERRRGRQLKIIMILRDPVRRSVSQYHMKRRRHNWSRSIEDVCLYPNGSVRVTSNNVIQHSMYALKLASWRKHFPRPGHLFIVNGDTLVRDPMSALEGIEEFLGVPQLLSRRNFIFNHTKKFYCTRSFCGEDVCLSANKGHKSYQPISEQLNRTLTDFFRPWNRRFYKMTGVDYGWPS